MTDVSVIYVNWNSAREILASVASVRQRTAGVSFEIIVVDNASAEGVEPLVRRDISLIRNQRNAGFGAGCNIGARHATGEFLLFLNPDTMLLNDALSILMAFMRGRPQCGAAGPLTREQDGAILFGAGRALPSLWREFLEHSTLTFRFPGNRIAGMPYYSFWDHCSTREVEALQGSCMMFRKEVFDRIGEFDERFFLYYEETDLCKRLRDAGLKVFYVHDAEILHTGKRSTTKRYKTVDVMVFRYFESAWCYFVKHNGLPYALAWRAMVAGMYLLRYLLHRKSVYLYYCLWAGGYRRAIKPDQEM